MFSAKACQKSLIKKIDKTGTNLFSGIFKVKIQ